MVRSYGYAVRLVWHYLLVQVGWRGKGAVAADFSHQDHLGMEGVS